MWLGNVQIVGAVAYWVVALSKIKGDASAFSLILNDARGHLHWQVCRGLSCELAEFDGDDKISGGQVIKIKEVVMKFSSAWPRSGIWRHTAELILLQPFI